MKISEFPTAFPTCIYHGQITSTGHTRIARLVYWHVSIFLLSIIGIRFRIMKFSWRKYWPIVPPYRVQWATGWDTTNILKLR